MNLLLDTLLGKVASDTGFDRELEQVGAWRSFASSQVRLRVWLKPLEGQAVAVALDSDAVVATLQSVGSPSGIAPPPFAVVVREVADLQGAHALLRRAFQLSRALPNAPLEAYERQLQEAPSRTEVERLVKQRVGQTIFRDALLQYWDGRCALTGLAVPALLRASHIKPWADCATDAERLDVHNGVLLAAHLDAAFDAGFISFDDSGSVIVSATLPAEARELLGLSSQLRARLQDGHRRYLSWHRERVFRSPAPA